MPQLQVKVNKLNIRKSPVKDFADKGNVVGVLHKDAVFKSVGTIENELGVWHVDGDGNWASEKWLSAALVNTQWWYQRLQIDELQKLAITTNRPNITVAVLDTGIVNNLNISEVFNVTGSKNFVDNTNSIIDAKSGHGTLCTSLIAASEKVFESINPQVKVFIGKVFTDTIATNEQIIANAITELCDTSFQPKIDIISISGGIDDVDPTSSVLTAAIRKAQEQSVIISAAVGNKLQTTTGYYPALYTYAFSVGALDQNFDFSVNLNPATTKIDYLIPGENIQSMNFLKSETEFDGTSHACAIMTGILSIILTVARSKGMIWKSEDVRLFLDSSCDNISFNEHIYKRLNPDLLIAKIKSL